jgi:hypothetical protein
MGAAIVNLPRWDAGYTPRRPGPSIRTPIDRFPSVQNPFPHLAHRLHLGRFEWRGDCDSSPISRRSHAQATRWAIQNACRPLPPCVEPISAHDISAARCACRRARQSRICLDGTPHTCPSNPICQTNHFASPSPSREPHFRTWRICGALGVSADAAIANLPGWAAGYVPRQRDLSAEALLGGSPFARNPFPRRPTHCSFDDLSVSVFWFAAELSPRTSAVWSIEIFHVPFFWPPFFGPRISFMSRLYFRLGAWSFGG